MQKSQMMLKSIADERRKMIKKIINIVWLVNTFLIPIFQSILANELYKDKKFNWDVLIKSKVFWVLLVIWIIGNVGAKFLKKEDDDNQNAIKQNKISLKGNGNTINQDVTNINNYADPIVEVNKIDDNIKLKDMMDGIAAVVGPKHVLTPYYSTGVKLENGNAVLYSKEEIPEAKIKYPTHYQGKFQINTKGITFDETMKRAAISQEPIEIKCCNLVKMLGDVEDPYQDILTKNAPESKFYIVPEPLPEPIHCSMKVKGKKTIYDDIWLQRMPVNPDDNIIVISNENKKGDIIIKLTYHKDTEITNFTYNFVADNWYQIEKNIHFLIEAREGETIQIRTHKTGELFFSCQLSNSLGEETIEELKNDLELVNKIISIIETYNCNIAVNLSITKKVENAIDTIYVGITNTFKESEWQEQSIIGDFSDVDLEELRKNTLINIKQKAFFEFAGLKFDNIYIDNEMEGRLKNYDDVKELIEEGTKEQTAIFEPNSNNISRKKVDLSSLQILKMEE